MPRSGHSLAAIAALLIVTGCTTRSPQLSGTHSPTITGAKNMPSATIRPTMPSAIAQTTTLSTPTSPLPPDGPYFAYLKEDGGNALRLLGIGATGGSQLTLPAGASFSSCLACLVSPDTEWLVFWTGSLHDPGQPITSRRYELSLHLLSLSNGTSRTIVELLSDDYPSNFLSNASDLASDFREDPNVLAESFEWAFNTGIFSASWSPNGRYLAFAGQMDGPSSDLYVYDTVLNTIQRRSSGRGSIMGLDWSPDGRWILQSSAFLFGEGAELDFHATTPDGAEYHDFDLTGLFGGWLSTKSFFTYHSQNGPGDFGLAVTNIETDQTQIVWPNSFDDFTYDPLNGLLLLGSSGPFVAPDGPQAGLYLLPAANWKPRLLAPGWSWETAYLGRPNATFVASGGDVGTAAISPYGQIAALTEGYSRPYPSPDQDSIALVGPYPAFPIYVYAFDGALTQVVSVSRAFDIYWQPNSSGFFFETDGALYCWGCPGEDLLQLDTNLGTSYRVQPGWVGE